MILAGFAPRKWVDKRTGELQVRTVLWLQRQDVPELQGTAFEEAMVRPEMLPPKFKLGDDIILIRNSSGFIQQVLNLNAL